MRATCEECRRDVDHASPDCRTHAERSAMLVRLHELANGSARERGPSENRQMWRARLRGRR